MASLSRKKLNEIRSHHPAIYRFDQKVLSQIDGTAVPARKFDAASIKEKSMMNRLRRSEIALLELWNTAYVLKYIGPCLQFHVSFFFKQCRTKLTLGFVQLTEFKPFCRLEDHKWIGKKWGLQEGDDVECGGIREYNFEQLCELVYDEQKEKTPREDEMLQEKQALKLESAAFKLESALFEAESTLFEEKRALLAEKKALFKKRQALIIAKGDFANESQMFETRQAHFLAFYLG